MARAERTVVVPETARPVESTGGAGTQVSISEQARRMAERSLERALTMVEGPKAREAVSGDGRTALPGKSGVGALRSKLVNALFERVQGKDTTTPPQDPAEAGLEENEASDTQATEAAQRGARDTEAQAPAEADGAAERARAQQEAAKVERAREEAAAEARRREAALRGEPEASEDPARPVSEGSRNADDPALPPQVGFGDDAAAVAGSEDAQAPEIGFSAARAQDETPEAQSTASESTSRSTRARADESTPVEARETPAQSPVEDAAQAPADGATQAQENADPASTPSTEDTSRAAPAVARRAAAYSADVAAQRSTAEAQIRLVV